MTLVTIKETVRTELEAAGIRAYVNTPGRWNPPFAIVQASPVYLERDKYGGWSVNLEIVLIAKQSTNLAEVSAVDEMIEDALSALQGKHAFGNVEEPDVFSDGTTQYLGAIINIINEELNI